MSTNFGGGSLSFGVAGGRVFYNTTDTSVSPYIRGLNSVALDGSNPLVLGTSTSAYPYVMAVSGTRVIVNEYSGSTISIVSYDIAQANSRTPLLANYSFMLLTGSRVAGFKPGATAGTYTVSAVNADGSASATLTPEIPQLDDTHLVLLASGQIVYRKAATSGQIEGYAVNLDGNGATQITTGAGDKELMALNGDRLIYQSYATGTPSATRNLQSVRVTGTDALDYATTTADERYLGQFADKLLYTSTNNAGTIEMKLIPAAGGAAVSLQSSANAKKFIGAF